MPFKIVRNDITKMNTEAIVNTANVNAIVGFGCDSAVYKAAGYDELMAYRKKYIGSVSEGNVFITPGFRLQARYIIHAVSPLFLGGKRGEEEKLRCCYRNSLKLARNYGIRSIAFPLIASGGFGYPREDAMRIAVDEINSFLLGNDMVIFLVVFDAQTTYLGEKICNDLERYIDQNYVNRASIEEYENACIDRSRPIQPTSGAFFSAAMPVHNYGCVQESEAANVAEPCIAYGRKCDEDTADDFESKHESKLEERMRHMADTYSEYLMYLIHEKNMENSEVYKRAIVDKKIFSKIKNNVNYHPNKMTALCLCIGAKLNLDESKDLLARAGYALSPCDKTDIIFSYFLENMIYDMIELDIQLEEHGLPCIIS